MPIRVAARGDGALAAEGPAMLFIEAGRPVSEAIIREASASVVPTVSVGAVVVIGLVIVGAAVTIGSWACWSEVRVSEVLMCTMARGLVMKVEVGTEGDGGWVSRPCRVLICSA